MTKRFLPRERSAYVSVFTAIIRFDAGPNNMTIVFQFRLSCNVLDILPLSSQSHCSHLPHSPYICWLFNIGHIQQNGTTGIFRHILIHRYQFQFLWRTYTHQRFSLIHYHGINIFFHQSRQIMKIIWNKQYLWMW